MPGLESTKNKDLFPLLESDPKKSTTFGLHEQRMPRTGNVSAGSAFPIEKAELAIAAFDGEIPLPPIPIEPIPIETLMRNALLLIDNGDYRLAETILRNVLARNHHNLEAIRWLGYVFRQSGRLDEASRCFNALAQLQPTHESYCFLGQILYERGQDRLAEESYQKALAKIESESPHLFEIYKNLGNIALRTGDVDSAEEHYNRAYTIHPNSDVLFVNFGTLELQKGRLNEAVERFRNALSLNEANDRAWIGLAMIYRQRGDNDLAWGNLERGLDINGSNVTGIRLCVEWGISDGQVEHAIRRLKSYLAERPNDADLAYALAGLLFSAGRIAESETQVELVLAMDPSRLDAMELHQMIVSKKRKVQVDA